MKIISEEDMAQRLDFVSPLHPKPEPPSNMWPIPFEYGGAAKGTHISVSKAREIAAELRAAVAAAEKRELRRAFDDERKRGDSLRAQLSAANDLRLDALAEVAALKKKLRGRR